MEQADFSQLAVFTINQESISCNEGSLERNYTPTVHEKDVQSPVGFVSEEVYSMIAAWELPGAGLTEDLKSNYACRMVPEPSRRVQISALPGPPSKFQRSLKNRSIRYDLLKISDTK